MTEHPITPPPELVEQWIEDTRTHDCVGAYDPEYGQCIALQAARWGADQELQACCAWMYDHFQCGLEWSKDLIAARRPKLPSRKEQVLDAWDRLRNEAWRQEIDADLNFIRSALEALPDD